jgi:tripartite ATP-independent transporter DctP family solute receptor
MSITLKTVAAALIAAACAHGALAAEKRIELRAADYWDDQYPTVKGLKRMGELLNERTGGRITLKVFASGGLGTEKETLEQVKIGALDLVRVNISPMNNICQETIVPTLPFLFRSIDHMHKALDSAIGDEILASCEAKGYVGLAYYDSGARSVYTKKPVHTLADMKGLKLRVQQSDLWVSLAAAMGANATPMPMGEVYTGMRTGLVDAAENNVPSYESSKHFEVVKYYSRTEHSMAPEVVMFSKSVWEKLSPEDQQIIKLAAKDSVPAQRKFWDERDAASLKIVLAGGAQIISDVDKKSFQDAMGPVYAKFVTTPKMKDLVKRIQDLK